MSGSPFNPTQIAQDIIDALAGNGATALSSVWDIARWWMNNGAAGQNLTISVQRGALLSLLSS